MRRGAVALAFACAVFVVVSPAASAAPGGNGPKGSNAPDESPGNSAGHGANVSGPYDATGIQGPGPGKGGGDATGQPCDGCVGNADNKNPPGQLPGPQDANVGYECEAGPNHGIGLGNPAHTTCGTADAVVVPTTPASPALTDPTPVGDVPPVVPAQPTLTPVPPQTPGTPGTPGTDDVPTITVDPSTPGTIVTPATPLAPGPDVVVDVPALVPSPTSNTPISPSVPGLTAVTPIPVTPGLTPATPTALTPTGALPALPFQPQLSATPLGAVLTGNDRATLVSPQLAQVSAAQAQPAQARGALATTGFGAVEFTLLALGITLFGRLLVTASREPRPGQGVVRLPR